MSTARFGRKWADVDEDEEEGLLESPKSRGARFETPLDENGIKTVIEYTEHDGKTYKVTKKVKQTTITNWTNKNITERKGISKFGKAAVSDAATEAQMIVRSHEDVNIELSKKLAAQPSIKDDAEDKFYEESLCLAENLTKEKKVWTDMNRDRQLDRDAGAGTSIRETMEEGKAAEGGEAAAADPSKPTSKYVPPSLRGLQDGGKGDGKGGKGADMAQQQEASLRITNLSEDCREGDLQDLFGQFGRLQRVYLAKDMTTGLSRGFAFITYYTKEDAKKAINKLNGHGYDNLILQVQFAKPRV